MYYKKYTTILKSNADSKMDVSSISTLIRVLIWKTRELRGDRDKDANLVTPVDLIFSLGDFSIDLRLPPLGAQLLISADLNMAGKVMRVAMWNWVLNICGELSEIIAAEMNRTKNKRCWVRKWLSRKEIYGASSTLLRELAEQDVPEYRNWLRMSKEQFESLLAQITPQISKKNTVMRSAIPARIKLEITLSYLATGNSFRTLQRLFCVSRAGISKFVPEVCDAIYESLKEYIKCIIVVFNPISGTNFTELDHLD
ncbi:hypothetical protein NQ318_013388 [Aromia moschata]|uniref:DDE Tnp4 domain-containing protein n=1 Tax=Aromia moschata TaxID=1265417 RepID=A0AAV8XUF5_9CUCU|nr:hypothetical protein NQ318_013388 [Aromia moschata]